MDDALPVRPVDGRTWRMRPGHVSALALAGLLLAAAPASADVRDASLPADPTAGHQRSDSWFGFTVGSGAGWERAGATSSSFTDTLSAYDPWALALAIRGGPTLGDRWLAGLELGVLRVMGSAKVTDFERGGVIYPGSTDVDAYLQTTTLSAIGVFFPQGDGPFVRAGAGVASFQEAYGTPDGQDRVTQLGLNAEAGAGWAFWVGTRLNVTVSLDASVQLFPGSEAGERDATRALVAGVGLDWF